VDQGDGGRAALIALWLAALYASRRAASVAAGWRNRAERLLKEEPDCRAHGLLAWQQIGAALAERDTDAALDHVKKAYEIGKRFGDRDLQALALLGKGLVHLSQGEVASATTLLDEAMAAATGRELSPQVTRRIYCETIAACQDLADYRRAGEWMAVWERESERQNIVVFSGDCRLHRAQILRLRGDWARAEQEARRACDEFMGWNVGVGHAGAALYEIGEIRLCQGNLAAAKDAFQEARQWGYDPQPGWSRLQLAEGNVEVAAASIARALSAESLGALDRARLLPARAEIALASGDLESARLATEELEEIAKTYSTTALEASALYARGGLELAKGAAAPACRSLRRGWRLWQDVDNPYEAARARMLLAAGCRAEGDDDAAVLELHTAISVFDHLGAAPDARRAEKLLGSRTGARAQVAGATRTFMFTDIVKSSNLIEVIGDEAWGDLLRWHDHTLRSLVETHGGEEINRTGDGFFVAFLSAPAAVECAVAIQRALADHRRVHGFAPQIRIGLHTAKATHKGRDYTGRGVHVAARIAALAEGEWILASVESLHDGSNVSVSNRRTVSLRGIGDPIEIARIEWR
jgi:class 3 adenylate cyclase